MISIINMKKVGLMGNLEVFKFEFEFDNASTLPVKTYSLEQRTYVIAEGSIATNVSKNIMYKYEDNTWVKTPAAEASTPVDVTNITSNGNFDITNNIYTGYNNITVDVSGGSEPTPTPVLIDKNITVNGQYSAQDDDADGYANVSVSVPNTYTNEDEGKVVNNGELVTQTTYATEITENDTYDTTLYNSITVNVPTGGGGSLSTDVVFYDYDGSVVTSYSATDFATLTAMPANPTHTGLTAQGWNWSLTDAKAYVASYGKLNIGQMYITSDGKTRLYFTVTKSNLSVELFLGLESDTELDIDWGDNSKHTTWTSADGDSSKSHEYASAGRYVIVIEVITGEFYPIGGAGSNIYKAEIGNGVVSIGDGAFQNCFSLTSITIPDGVTTVNYNAFYECYSLTSITIPDSVTSIGFDAFYECYSLTSITIPDGVTSISDYAFTGCSSLSSITIPDTVTSIGSSAFSSCSSLSSVIIPDSVTTIEGEAFSGCYSLTSVAIPDSVTSINIHGNPFDECYALLSITFESLTPPNSDNPFTIPYTCIIRVPQGSLEAYTSAENYPDPSAYIYEEY